MLERLGADHLGNGDFGFLLWAPLRDRVDIKILSPSPEVIPMRRADNGYFEAVARGIGAGARYLYVLDGEIERPDPASRHQPEGVHGPSATVDLDAMGRADLEWKNLPLEDYIIYELHVGAFTPEGTFQAIASMLPYLRELGVNALELMPIGQFPGGRNWGYDGAFPYAAQASYGGPEGLRLLIEECHLNGMAVLLDVVYNHLGPEGNYLRDFGPYFTDRYRSPWGDALNFDGPMSDEVRRFFIENALYWVEDFHIDALRIDAVHGIYDMGARHFLAELREETERRASRRAYLIPESDLNDVRLLNPPSMGGYGLDAQWNDDFHHALHTLLTGERRGYYEDFGRLEDLHKSMREGFVYSGRRSAFRGRRHGSSSAHIPPSRFVVFSQNHDQVGNRPAGDRPSASLPLEKLKLAAALVILSPSIPLLFMGEEYGETAPFRYFISHSDTALVEAVREGRKAEFSSFNWEGDPPDPQDEAAFLSSKLDHGLRRAGWHRELYGLYRELIRLRKELGPILTGPEEMEVVALDGERAILLMLRRGVERIISAASFNERPVEIRIPPNWAGDGPWKRLLYCSAPDSPGTDEGGSDKISGLVGLSPYGFSIYRREA